ncbi:MAG: hypothetical protein VX704_00720 [Verrucomicrobiota bacterium]|jgi:hypothetical protein|nr:hypothetical protein [Verrucomicrobiota bacterium]MED6313536.1 hypothetical protein [Verrucomicrobiota bacterium]|tara:strand:- start:41 stop:895 length:855 start_codon:yes stop_codon:yes gene_type:complete
MSKIKRTFMAVAFVAGSTGTQAGNLSDSLPLAKSLAAGQELPLPLGISGNVFYQEQDLKAQSIAIDIPPLPLPTGQLQLPPGLPAQSTNLESRATSTTAKLDAWLLPFLNVYGVAGYVDGETTASGFSVAGLPPEVASLLPNSFSISYSGPVYGGGATLAAGFKNYFASLDANYTESDLDIGDSTIEAFILTPRLGVTGSLGGLNGSLYIGAMYQDVDEQQNGTANFPVMGQPVPVGYDVISEAEDEWNYLVGTNLKAGENWNYGIEVGFSGRTHVMATLNYRF